MQPERERNVCLNVIAFTFRADYMVNDVLLLQCQIISINN